MKKLLILFLSILTINLKAQTKVLHAGELDWYEGEQPIPLIYNQKTNQVMSCASGALLSTGYPLWTNYWAGYMIKINNISTCSITINCFEARFDGTSGYRIYTKTGTFVGFETTAGSWILVGTVASITSISTIAPTPIPIAVNVTIPPASSQSFYLTRTDNVIANRHLYITGLGTAGTTVYANDANIQITEGSYVDPFFAALQIGVRRPSLDIYYTKVCSVLPVELIDFKGSAKNDYNALEWSTITEHNNDHFILESSLDGVKFNEVHKINSQGDSYNKITYHFNDFNLNTDKITYYQLISVDNQGIKEYSNIIAIENQLLTKKVIKTLNILGQEVSSDYDGIKIIYYSDGSHN